MPQDIKIWAIHEGEELRELQSSKLDLEERLERWLESDVSILADDLIIIGRQVTTDYGGIIDLLCLDIEGDLVVVELKRERTPREITSQVLDYASWVNDLSIEKITDLAASYYGSEEEFSQAYFKRFGNPLPEILNERHKMIIVAAQVDPDSERIINYLSDTYGVSINAASFHYFKEADGKEHLARVFLIEPSEVEYKSKTRRSSKRRPPLTMDELQDIASERGAGDLFNTALDSLAPQFNYRSTTRSTVAFIGIIKGSRRTILSIIPGQSTAEEGVQFSLYIDRLADYLGTGREEIDPVLPSGAEEIQTYQNAPTTVSGFFRAASEIDRFIDGINSLRQTT